MRFVSRHIPHVFLTSVACAVVLVPAVASAQVFITELMYDRDGTDSDHEWIEVYNAGESAVVLSNWRLYENDTNHHIESSAGGETLAAGDYAVIADKPDVFVADWPSYSGQVFDSAFSLNNTAETLVLRDGELADRDSLTYESTMGASGDGNTLHRPSTATSELEPGAPSPGSGDVHAPVLQEEPAEEVSSQQTSTENASAAGDAQSTDTSANTTPTKSNTDTNTPRTLQVDAGADKTVIAGVPAELTGTVSYSDGSPLAPGAATLAWNFGDGTTGRGAHPQHTWEYPGRYAVVLTATFNGREDSHTIAVTATEPQVVIDADTDGVVLTNEASRNLDLSHWQVRSGGYTFAIPSNTILLSRGSVRFSYKTMNLNPSGDTALLYPNGAVAAEAGEASEEESEGQAAVAAQPPPPPARASNAGGSAPEPPPALEPQKEPDTTEQSATTSATSSQLAAAGAAAPSFFSFSNPWLIGLLVLLAVGALGAAAARAASRSEWTIIEED